MRILALLALLLALGWWFTRDVTYVSNVKVSGLNATAEAYRQPLRSLAEDFAYIVNQLAERGYAWQSGALPALRAADSLSRQEQSQYLALGSLQVRGGESLAGGRAALDIGGQLQSRGWRSGGDGSLQGARRSVGALRGEIRVVPYPDGRQQLLLEVTTP